MRVAARDDAALDGEVQRRTPVQVSVGLTITAPVSPSTPTSRVLLMYQTIASAVPLLVVAMGAVTSPASAAHQTTRGASGAPGGISTDMTTLPVGIPAGHMAPESVENVTCTPCAVLYAAGTVWIDIPVAATLKSSR